MTMIEFIVQERTVSQAAAELNARGFRMRRGTEWGPASVFNLLPRMIEVGPNVFSQEEWAARRLTLLRRFLRAVSTSSAPWLRCNGYESPCLELIGTT